MKPTVPRQDHIFCKWCSREMFFISYTPDGYEEYACPCGKTYRKCAFNGKE